MYEVMRQADIPPRAVQDLREAVGWDRSEGTTARVLAQSYAHFSITDASGLVGFLRVVSDGVDDAYLGDLMVHPRLQRKGLGRALITRALEELSADRIRCIQVTFHPGLEPFYRACGFDIIGAGIIDRFDRAREQRTG